MDGADYSCPVAWGLVVGIPVNEMEEIVSESFFRLQERLPFLVKSTAMKAA